MKHSPLIGREREQRILRDALASPNAELVLVSGRRRVGATSLVEDLGKHVTGNAGLHVRVFGQLGAPLRTQLHQFRRAIEEMALGQAGDERGGVFIHPIPSWNDAFEVLAHAVERWVGNHTDRPILVHFDEPQWLDTHRSDFLGVFARHWDSRLSRLGNLMLALSSNSTGWLVEHILRSRTGFHNRVTRHLRLHPFGLADTETYLQKHGFPWDRPDIMLAYFAIGGMPSYLRQLDRQRTPRENLAAICLDQRGALYSEREPIVEGAGDTARALLNAMAGRRYPLTRAEMLEATGRKTSGGFAHIQRVLEEDDYLASLRRFGNRRKGTRYYLVDEQLRFQHTWGDRLDAADRWRAAKGTSKEARWAKAAFESLCIRHLDRIAAAVSMPEADISTWNAPDKEQVDLVLEDDRAITLVVLEYSPDPYRLTNAKAAALERHRARFEATAKTDKAVGLALVVPFFVAPETTESSIIPVTLDHLFERSDAS